MKLVPESTQRAIIKLCGVVDYEDIKFERDGVSGVIAAWSMIHKWAAIVHVSIQTPLNVAFTNDVDYYDNSVFHRAVNMAIRSCHYRGIERVDLLPITAVAMEIVELSPGVKQDPHAGMIYNAYLDKWVWF